MNTQQIYQFLRKRVKGQDESLQHIAVALELHNQRIHGRGMMRENILIAGPTGCGKTETIRAIRDLGLDCPVVETSAIEYSPNAWHGQDMKYIFSISGEHAEHAIIVLDEFDKVLWHLGFSHDWQSAMLKLMEGEDIECYDDEGESVTINTGDMLFILIGAFPGLLPKPIGYGDTVYHTTRQDYARYGVMPEFLGRVPIICEYKPVTVDMLVDILQHTFSIYKEWKLRFYEHNVILKIHEDALRLLAERALLEGIGARGLMTVFAQELYPRFFHLNDNIKHLTLSRKGDVIAYDETP